MQKLPIKINVSLSLAKRKLAEKKMNGSCLIIQVRSCVLPYASQISEKTSFFQLPYLEHDSMVANLVRLNLVVLKILETSQ